MLQTEHDNEPVLFNPLQPVLDLINFCWRVESTGSGGQTSPSRVQGQSPLVSGDGDKVSKKFKHFDTEHSTTLSVIGSYSAEMNATYANSKRTLVHWSLWGFACNPLIVRSTPPS